jgi:hypothetical protein
MIPKEQAIELFEKFTLETGNETFAKKCAKVAVDLVLSAYLKSVEEIEYWQEVEYWIDKYDN